ncbi:MAG: leucyl aminopeptidase [Pseudomonadota bacterium]|nr:leucyl aminopeptidase [Pseudomonadota bacterium]
MKIHFTDLANAAKHTSAVIFPVGEDKKLTPLARGFDKQAGGALTRALGSGRFSGKHGQHVSIAAPASVKADRVVLAGVGEAKTLDRQALEKIGGALVPQLNYLGAHSAVFVLENLKGTKVRPMDAAAYIAHGVRLKSYRFDKYHTKTPDDEKPTLTSFAVALDHPSHAEKPFAELDRLADGVSLTRDLVTEPPNVIYPESLATQCMELKKLGVDVQVLDEAAMKKIGMNALLGVGQGSAKESQLVVMRWNGLSKSAKTPPVAFVGKGVTFDTGGISIKPANGMEDMKYDMGGAGVVIGLMKALAGRKARVNAVGVAGLVENMPGGNAQRPSDVVTSMSGQTIEVLNTDAEGRLVLADALWYTQDRFKPKFIVDLATLTGAIVVALGTSRAGLFSNDDKLSDQLFETGRKIGEKVWRLPLDDVYDKQINSDIADMQNIGKDREAGSITAAQFLQRFVNKTPWAHLDIAGVAWDKKGSDIAPKGATAWGVRLLNELVRDYYEAHAD